MISVKTETWKAIDAEIEEIAGFHWEELALDQLLFKRDLDHERYLKMDDLGMMHVVTARSFEGKGECRDPYCPCQNCGACYYEGNNPFPPYAGKLVGYIVCFVMPHLHYKSSGLTALADMYYLLPDYRKGGLGVRMFREMERGLKERGVIRAHMSCKVHENHTKLFEGMGWTLTDYTFSKLLMEAK